MRLEQLKFYQYRNIKTGELKLSPVLNIFIGKNGQGKTNIIEAVHLLTNGKAFRPGNNIHIINRSIHDKKAYIGASVKKQSVKNFIEAQFSEKTKTYLLNNKRVSGAKLQQHFPCVLFSPESLSAIKSGPDERRVLVDDLLCLIDSQNAELLANFTKLLRNRNKCLKNYRDEKLNQNEFKALFASINEQYYPICLELTVKRIEAIEAIKESFSEIMGRISNQNVESSVEYVASGNTLNRKSREEIEETLRERAYQLQSAELSTFSSLFGPHKHDIQIIFEGNDSRYYCSQGQQRALILSFKMAQIVYHNARYGVFPVLLLDDVLSELDEEKRSFLIAFLKENEAQTFITTTEFDFPEFKNMESIHVFEVSEGEVSLVK
ncbi:MAG: DNA replication/repair protein RecF [Bdellovibrionales bacterium]